MKNQTDAFDKESLRYVRSTLDNAACQCLPDEALFAFGKIDRILDVGCGNGARLQSLAERFAAAGVGVEPSAEAVDLLTAKHAGSPNLSFTRASAHCLPFETDSFDLVHAWSVLHWVGRNEYLQALGELLRVTRNYLVIMDFVAGVDYRVPYCHDPRFFTYKMDFEAPVLGSGIMEKVYASSWWSPPATGETRPVQAADLHPFLGNELSYHARKMVIFRKNYELLPLRERSDFEPKR